MFLPEETSSPFSPGGGADPLTVYITVVLASTGKKRCKYVFGSVSYDNINIAVIFLFLIKGTSDRSSVNV